MDPVHVLTQRLNHFADSLRASGAGDFVPPTLEQWLEFWDDDETDLGNLRNLDHWLSTRATRSRPARDASICR